MNPYRSSTKQESKNRVDSKNKHENDVTETTANDSESKHIPDVPDTFILLLLRPYEVKYLRLSDNFSQVDRRTSDINSDLESTENSRWAPSLRVNP